MEQISSSLGTANLLFVGDCKLSALATRAWIATQGHFYLSPLAGTGKTPKLLQAWIEAAVSGQIELTEVEITTATAQDPQLVQGYEVERELEVVVDQQLVRWQERVFILHSPTLKQQQQRGLETRLNTATTKLLALTPTPGRGKRQLTDETQLIEKANAILRQHRVQEFLTYDYELQSTGKPRYQITQVKRHQVMIDAHQARCGWRAGSDMEVVVRLKSSPALYCSHE